jgi:hypothetical protein
VGESRRDPSAWVEPDSRARVAWRELGLIALAAFALLMVFANRYGFHRDELYFMEAGHHLAFGYDDQPPLTPLIARGATAVFGATPAGLRVPSALAFVACLLLTGLTARELGAGRRGQGAAVLALFASALIYLGHLVSTATYDFLAWTVLLYLLVRIRGRDEPRLWLVFGLVLGLALQNKWLPLTLIACVVAGAVVSRDTQVLRNRWVLAAAAIALLIWLPNVIWQADHGWPQRTLARQIADEDPLGARVKFLPYQLLLISPFLVYVWFRGLRWLLGAPEARRWRMLGVGFVVLVALCLVSGAKEYYAIGFYPLLLAAGGAALEGHWAATRPRRRLAAALVLSAAIAWTIQLPIVPQDSVGGNPLVALNDDTLESIGWPRFVDAVAHVYRSLPAAERSRAVIFTASYGEAGAIQQYGSARGLPRAYSGHNSFAQFARPPDAGAPVIVVGFDNRAYLDRFFSGCRLVLRFDNRLDVDNEEQGAPISLCAGPRGKWSDLWSSLHHLNA